MTTEKKCYNCVNDEGMCLMSHTIKQIAHQLIVNIQINDAGETGYHVMIHTLAHDCLRFKSID